MAEYLFVNVFFFNIQNLTICQHWVNQLTKWWIPFCRKSQVSYTKMSKDFHSFHYKVTTVRSDHSVMPRILSNRGEKLINGRFITSAFILTWILVSHLLIFSMKVKSNKCCLNLKFEFNPYSYKRKNIFSSRVSYNSNTHRELKSVWVIEL